MSFGFITPAIYLYGLDWKITQHIPSLTQSHPFRCKEIVQLDLTIIPVYFKAVVAKLQPGGQLQHSALFHAARQ